MMISANIFKTIALMKLASVAALPQVVVQQGTYQGKYVAGYDQDLFLGIPYAQPPVGDLRFQNPQPLNATFDGVQNATEYADSCVGYGNSAAWPFTLGEDCLTLNVVRPSGSLGNGLLPVGVFIHGGGWTMDYSANGVYNMSWMVSQSVKMNKPIIGVSLDYRLSAWGFLGSQEALDAGIGNMGLKDQRVALRYIKDNIKAFGGDPKKITIFGESAGGGSVGFQALAYDGQDESLYRGIISQSGADGSAMKSLETRNAAYHNLTIATGCDEAADTLACLREAPFEVLNSAIVNNTSGGFGPMVDGEFLTDYPSVLLQDGKFTRTPMLAGTNSDEGTLFGGSTIDTEEELAASLVNAGFDNEAVKIMLALYPDIDALTLPAGYQTPLDGSVGRQFKRYVTIQTDNGFLSWRRRRSDAYYEYDMPFYSYHFDGPISARETSPPLGSSHFAEVAYVFYNLEGQGYAENAGIFPTSNQDLNDLANLMSRMWVSFINDLNPNNHGIVGVKEWPLYNNTGGFGQNFLFVPGNSHAEPDTFRLAGTTYINTISKQLGR
ncbi:hypothetical protein PFICI_03404 [Pestalotiopsis fici W106-1]|uniref:Carboxylic ester hydrolase n=1 Tax=Pestalotiopsis fici (strain W106-1 / CGMCC3.15140) TaxID=1229662 RepID=W3XHB0_PESFW|nr:uncharacterized protein PFICI_03404 [Pestalotiopsis fici W106-1]ETS85379.1 hypothetical protein PFICI_03404 [Pestalotiopsis fici W106-1]